LKRFKRRPVWVRTDKGKEFLNSAFQNLLKHEGIQFQVCRNPDIKCSVVERAQRTIRDKLYKFFTYKNTYRYIDVLQDFVTGYNAALAQPIDLGSSSEWEVGPIEITYLPPKRVVLGGALIDFIGSQNALIYCDLIAPQFVREDKFRILRPIILWPATGKHLFQNNYYFPEEKSEFQDIHIELKLLDGEPPEFQETDVPVKAVLHFRRI